MYQRFMFQPKWILILLLLSCFTASAQPDFSLPLSKPKKYEDKELGAEKTDAKKFTVPRRLFQGMITHYNYYYNANRKIDEILERAKMAHRDDYNELLPFYNYSTKTTQGDSIELDSILYKATTGIVLHDLRNSYVDNLYQIIGKSYFYWRKFDSAHRIFQFINYNFFPKGKDEYIIVVGANSRASGGELNIANKENKNIVHRAFSQPPSRNEALYWLAKTYAEDSLYPEALSVTGMLRKDIYFPKRLHSQLDEVNAYVFYQQEQWDSCAFYLERSLINVENKSELARWEYLLAQLYSILKNPLLASSYFNKAKNHTTDPVMYIHARIYESQLVKNEQGNTIQAALNDLVKLSKRERFDGFEDVLFYAASGMALQLKDTAFAKALLQKSTKYNTENPSLRNKAFLKLAGIAFNQKDYEFASSCYDSLDMQDIALADQSAQLQLRKTVLNELVKNIKTVKLQDSLQAVAKMPEKEMDAYLKAIVKKLRKQRGLKEEAETNYNPAILTGNPNNETPVFNTSGTGTGWYFNNNSQKSKGFSEFVAKWGKRPNLDNWRRIEAVNKTFTPQEGVNAGNPNGTFAKSGNTGETMVEDELTVDGLKAKLPLTDDKLKASNLEILSALITQGQIYKNQLEDYEQAAAVFEEILKRFSNFAQEEEVLFELYYCNKKAGNIEKANYFQSVLNKNFPKGEFENKITAGSKPPVKDDKTIAYENIYNLFIEGNFSEALKQKAVADSVYGKSYWTPQLLYIQSLYYIKEKSDSVALKTLTDIETNFPGTAMAEKATVMKDVLMRRTEIEDYLTNTNIVREKDDLIIPEDEGPKVSKPQVETKKQENKIAAENKPSQNNNNLEKPKAPVQKTGIEKQDRPNVKPGIGTIVAKDSTKIKPLKDVKVQMAYVYNANEPYVVMMLFEKVDPVYISEAKIAFQRYNNSAHANEGIQINIHEGAADDLSWIDMGPKADITSILGYFDELKANARQIVPWLPVDKYQFIFISQANLEILKQRKNLEEYKLFIRQYVKDKF
jgi:outer membrane protein assembly factor BamD (BamD/ComL family)